jgi:tryptophan 2,3-dioxygenase
LEVLGGLCETAGEGYARRVEAQWPGLRAEVKITLHQALLGLLDRCGFGLVEIYQRRWEHFDLFTLCEACIEFDSKFVTWRENHVKMVQRMIGGRAKGTGGSGVPYLAHTTAYRFFPELWEARNALTGEAGGYVYEE